VLSANGVLEVVIGDMDCDGDTDFDDIAPFVQGLNDPAGYEATYGLPPEVKGDIDADGDQDFDDIGPFVDLLRSGPSHFTERDYFPDTEGVFELIKPDGTSEAIVAHGPTLVDVWFEDKAGQANDDSGNGLDEVMTHMVSLDLWGTSSMGPVHVRLNPNDPSMGVIEEKQNNTPGVLDLDPFAPGDALSSFDLNLVVEVATPDGQTIDLLTERPKHLQTTITEKPPGPGNTYESPETIQLVFPGGRPSGFAIGATRHTPRPFVEHDLFDNTQAVLELLGPTGSSETIVVHGPTAVDVQFERREGEAQDDSGNGRDEVQTEIVDMNLQGTSSMGPIHVTLNPDMPSVGGIEELVNNTPGWLDLDPFNPGDADSFFDVFFDITVDTPNGPLVLHNAKPKHMQTVITDKPPGPGNTYESPERIELFDAAGNPTGFFLGATRHTPRPFVEHDLFDNTQAVLELLGPTGSSETIVVHGPTAVDVQFESREGEAQDDSGNGRDEVQTEIVDMNLQGTSSMGPIHVTLNPDMPSVGGIEELVNNTPGWLDLDPFNPGDADSFFDVFFDITVDTPNGPLVLHNAKPKHMQTVITDKPPGPGNTYESPERIELFDAAGNPTGFFLGATRHTPNPLPPDHFVEHDVFPDTVALVDLLGADVIETVTLSGPMKIDVWFDGPNEGDATDDDGDGFDEVQTEMVALDLTGFSPSLGQISIHLDPNVPSQGVIQEVDNAIPGVLEVPPFAPGQADSFFDVAFQVQVEQLPGVVLIAEHPKQMFAVITNKPPGRNDVYQSIDTAPVQLLLPGGRPSGFAIGSVQHFPVALTVVLGSKADAIEGLAMALVDPSAYTEAHGVAPAAEFDSDSDGDVDFDDIGAYVTQLLSRTSTNSLTAAAVARRLSHDSGAAREAALAVSEDWLDGLRVNVS